MKFTYSDLSLETAHDEKNNKAEDPACDCTSNLIIAIFKIVGQIVIMDEILEEFELVYEK